MALAGVLGGSAGLLFKIEADSSGAMRELRAVDAAFGGLVSRMSTFGGIASVAAASFAAIGAAAVTAGVAIFNFTKQAAEYGSELYDASIQTGLSAEAISALKLAADSSGSSLENISGSVAKFNVLLGQAAQGNEKSIATLERYGITAKTTDEALNQAIATIGNMATADQKAAAAKDLFKDRTGAILPVIDQVDGKFKEYIATAKKLGVVLTEEDLKAADEFGDTLEVLGTQAKIAGVQFASSFMPNVTHAMNSISASMSNNQSVAREWGRVVGDTIRGAEIAFPRLADIATLNLRIIDAAFGTNAANSVNWATVLLSSLGVVGQTIEALRQTGAADPIGISAGIGVTRPRIALPQIAGGGGGKGGGASAKDDAARKAEAELNDLIQIQEKKIKRLEDTYRDAMERIRAEFKKTGDESVFNEQAAAEIQKFVDAVGDAREELLKLEDKLNENKSDTKQRLALIKQWDDVKALSTKIRKDREENDVLRSESAEKAAEIEKKLFDEIADFAEESSKRIHDTVVKNAEAEIDAAIEVYKATIESRRLSAKDRALIDNDLAQVLARNAGVLRYENKVMFDNAVIALDTWKREKEEEVRAHVKDEETRKAKLEEVNREYERRLQLLKDIHDQEEKNIQKREATPVVQGPNASPIFGLKGPLEELKALAKETFATFAQGMGQIIQNWVLLGSAGPSAMRKLTASILAGLAAQAAVKSLFYLAEGIVALLNPFTAWQAPGYFKASAIMGAIAAGAAVAGRAAAGDLFQQQTNAATGQAGSQSSSGNRAGGAFSQQPNRVVETGVNAPTGGANLGLTVTVRDRSGSGSIFSQLFKMEWERNGPIRQILREEFG